MLNTPFPPWPSFTNEEAAEIQRVLLSNRVNYWTGTEGRDFETEFAKWADVNHAIAVANGTVALDLALKALEIGPGDEVVVTPRTFIASASCIANAGARPVFADVDRDSQNITAESIRNVLSPKTKAIICVHLAGWPCDMDPIIELSEERRLAVIEDCAQSHGAQYKGRSTGTIGHIGAWSFCQDKIMTTGGEGGMVTTNDPDLWSRMWAFKDHGKDWNAVYEREHPPGFRWLHESFGTNFRLTEMQSAIGRIQLRRMPEWHRIRRGNASILERHFSALPGLRVTTPPSHIEHAYYKYYTFVRPSALKTGWNRDRVMQSIVDQGVPCYSGSCSEVYLEKAFADAALQPRQRLPVARELGETGLMFLVHPTLGADHMEKTAETVKAVMTQATR